MSVNRHESELAEAHAARLTAYALGQLEGQERAEVEHELAASPTARQTVESIRALADHLVEATRGDTAAGPSASLRAAVFGRLDELEACDAAAPKPRRTSRHGLRLLVALAACLLITAIPLAWLTGLNRRPGGGAVALAPPAQAGKSVGLGGQEPLAQPAPASPDQSPIPAPPAPGIARAGEALVAGHVAGGVPTPPAGAVAPGVPMERVETSLAPKEPVQGGFGVSGAMAESSPPVPSPNAAPPADSSAPASPAEKPASTALGFTGAADRFSRDEQKRKGGTPPSERADGRSRETREMPGMPGGAGYSSLAETNIPKAAAQSHGGQGVAELRRSAPVASPIAGPWGVKPGMATGLPAREGSLGGFPPGYPGNAMQPGYPGMPEIAGRGGQASMPSRATAAMSPTAPSHARELLQDASLGMRQEAALEVESTRRSARPRKTMESESPVALGTPIYRGAESQATIEHPFVEAGPFPVSLLPLEVDRTQYEVVAAAVQAKQWPRPETVDIHGLINAFPYREPAALSGGGLAVSLEVAECPWKPGHRLVRVAVTAAEPRAAPAPQALAKKSEKGAWVRASAGGPAKAPAGKPSPGAPEPVVARDVRVMVEFNPLQAAAYRLIGVEVPAALPPAGADAGVSAAVLRAGQRVVGLYQVIPPGSANAAQFPQLRYQHIAPSTSNLTKDAYSGQLLTVHVQYREAASGKLQQAEFALKDSSKPFAEASADLRFAAAVAAFGMLVRHSPYAGSATLDWVEKTALQAARDAPAEQRTQFVEWVRQLRRIPAH